MSVRETINNKPVIPIALVVIAVVVIGVVGYSRLGRATGQPGRAEVWYYDLNTSSLFAATDMRLPPVDAPSGQTPEGEPAGVRAYVYSCDDCRDAVDQQKIGHLETFSLEADEQAREALGEGGYFRFQDLPEEDQRELVRDQHFVKQPEDAGWTHAYTAAGEEIRHTLPTCDNGNYARQCSP